MSDETAKPEPQPSAEITVKIPMETIKTIGVWIHRVGLWAGLLLLYWLKHGDSATLDRLKDAVGLYVDMGK